MNRGPLNAVVRAAFFLVALWTVDSRAPVHGEDTSSPRTEAHSEPAFDGVLVLQSGGVLAGRISRDGERYVVVGANSEVRVLAKSVTMKCGSLAEAYRRKRDQIAPPTAEAHLELAEWCLRHGLMPEAETELAAVRQLDAQHFKLSLMERRLAVIRRSKEGSEERGARSKEQGAEGEERGARSELEAESRSESVAPGALTEDLPDGALERFTRKVQPVLVNNCTTSGCHHVGGEQPFQLDRSLLHGQSNRRSTQHNLAAVLELVDYNAPQLSPLLKIPRRSHGGMEEPLIGPRQEQQFAQLVEWVALVTKTPPPKSATHAKQKSPAKASGAAPADVVPASVELPVPRDAAKPRVQFGATPEPQGPKDPFDPEIFNGQSQRDGSR